MNFTLQTQYATSLTCQKIVGIEAQKKWAKGLRTTYPDFKHVLGSNYSMIFHKIHQTINMIWFIYQYLPNQ